VRVYLIFGIITRKLYSGQLFSLIILYIVYVDSKVIFYYRIKTFGLSIPL